MTLWKSICNHKTRDKNVWTKRSAFLKMLQTLKVLNDSYTQRNVYSVAWLYSVGYLPIPSVVYKLLTYKHSHSKTLRNFHIYQIMVNLVIYGRKNAWKVSKYGVLFSSCLSVFELNTGKRNLRIWTPFTQWKKYGTRPLKNLKWYGLLANFLICYSKWF